LGQPEIRRRTFQTSTRRPCQSPGGNPTRGREEKKKKAHPVKLFHREDCNLEALDEIGVTAEERGRRTITFHSWRAFANTFMVVRGISGEKVRQLIRHDSEEMTGHYSDFHLEMLCLTGFF